MKKIINIILSLIFLWGFYHLQKSGKSKQTFFTQKTINDQNRSMSSQSVKNDPSGSIQTQSNSTTIINDQQAPIPYKDQSPHQEGSEIKSKSQDQNPSQTTSDSTNHASEGKTNTAETSNTIVKSEELRVIKVDLQQRILQEKYIPQFTMQEEITENAEN